MNTAIALHRELDRKVALVDGNLQFGDHRVFLDLGLDRKGIVDVASAPLIDGELIGGVLVRHASGVQLLLGPTSPETAELVTADHMPPIVDHLRSLGATVQTGRFRTDMLVEIANDGPFTVMIEV